MRTDMISCQTTRQMALKAFLPLFNRPRHASGVHYGVRGPRRGTSSSELWLVPSRKNGGLMPCESEPERIFCWQLENDPHIDVYRAQPISIEAAPGSSYTPDFIARDDRHRYSFHEIKHAHMHAKRHYAELRPVRHLLRRLGFSFYVWYPKKNYRFTTKNFQLECFGSESC